jgi:hypothetical protein
MSTARIAEPTAGPQLEPSIVTANQIVLIRPIKLGGDDYRFLVTVSDTHWGETRGKATVEVDADALLTYLAFRRALLRGFGLHFRSDEFEGRRRGSDPWSEEIEQRMARGGHHGGVRILHL